MLSRGRITDMCADARGDGYRHVHRPMYADTCIDMRTKKMCADICTDTCADMCTDMRPDMRADICIDMCADMGICRHVHVRRDVWNHGLQRALQPVS